MKYKVDLKQYCKRNGKKMMKKITVIGAGSIGFTRNLLTDILSVKELQNVQISFTDINKQNLEMVTKLCQRDIDYNGFNILIDSTTDRKRALVDADYVVNTVRIGGLEAFEKDIEIPLRYGIEQCVGDTLCAGGIFYAQRGIHEILKFCEDIKKYSKKDVILFNYANPNAMVTWACNQYGGVKTIGLCHGTINGHNDIAKVFGLLKEEIDIICVGINHQTWYVSIKHDGEELTDKLLEKFESNEYYSDKEKVRIDMMKRFGYFSTESNGHLSEYLSWYRKRPQEIGKWISFESWIDGETGGYLRICRESRNWFEHDFPNWMKEEPKKYSTQNHRYEHLSHIIESLETGRTYRGHFNVVNRGTITNLPDDAVVEVPCYVDRNGIAVPKFGDLPPGCAAICNQSISVQRLAVEAAVKGDAHLLKQAMLMDPLTGAILNPVEVWQLTDEMLIEEAKWLPQYAKEIEMAKMRIEESKQNGTYITKPPYISENMLKEKTLEEMEKEREKTSAMAMASSKG